MNIQQQIKLAKNAITERQIQIGFVLGNKTYLQRDYVANEIRKKRAEIFAIKNEVKTCFGIDLNIHN